MVLKQYAQNLIPTSGGKGGEILPLMAATRSVTRQIQAPNS